MTIRPASDRSLLVSFGEEISLDAHHHVNHLTHSLQGVRGILNLHPAFTTVLVDFDPRLYEHAEVEKLIHDRFASAPREQAEEARTVEVPVRLAAKAVRT